MAVDHDLKPGPLRHCQITGSTDLFEAIDLGHQPPCEALLTRAALDEPETGYPLRLLVCPESGLGELDYVVDGSVLFYPNYPYRGGISKPLADEHRTFADGLGKVYRVTAKDLVVDIGSNDGTFLSGFARLGARTLGVEPTNIAEIARSENRVETIQAFFTEAVAAEIVKSHGQAKLVTMTNAFANMAELGEVMRGLGHLLEPGGVFFVDTQSLLDVLEKNQFDVICHEHVRTYSLKSLVALASAYGLEVFDVQRSSRFGGHIRAYLARRGTFPTKPSVRALLLVEERANLFTPPTWTAFRDRVERNRELFMDFAYHAARDGQSVAGNSCPGRASTLLNYYGVNRRLMPYIAELPASLKLGLFVPGVHIPVVDNRRLFDDQPDYVVLFAWHYGEYMAQTLRKQGLKSKFVVPLPEFAILDV
jgi:hypothetical protein